MWTGVVVARANVRTRGAVAVDGVVRARWLAPSGGVVAARQLPGVAAATATQGLLPLSRSCSTRRPAPARCLLVEVGDDVGEPRFDVERAVRFPIVPALRHSATVSDVSASAVTRRTWASDSSKIREASLSSVATW